MSPVPGSDEEYLLVDLAWCGPCELALLPALITGRRFYACRNIHCPCPVVPAGLLDEWAWRAFLHRFTQPDIDRTTHEKRQILERALERVTVGMGLGQIRYHWREPS
ncbi:hypothetical protein ACNTMW_09945 [Planosporangium sp. 12N6]